MQLQSMRRMETCKKSRTRRENFCEEGDKKFENNKRSSLFIREIYTELGEEHRQSVEIRMIFQKIF